MKAIFLTGLHSFKKKKNCSEYNEKACLCGKIFLYPVMLLFKLMKCEIYQQVFSVLFHSVVDFFQHLTGIELKMSMDSNI